MCDFIFVDFSNERMLQTDPLYLENLEKELDEKDPSAENNVTQSDQNDNKGQPEEQNIKHEKKVIQPIKKKRWFFLRK